MSKKKRYLLLGYGISNQAVRHYFDINNIEYIIYDDYNSKYKDHLDFNSFEVIIKSPIIKEDNWIIKIAKSLDIEVLTDLELFYKSTKTKKIIALTGTNGKTTTVHLISELIKGADLAGNLGIPLFDFVESNNDIIIEASSFMLEYIKEFHADYNIFLNISQNHLDHHGSYLNYVDAKLKMIKNIRPSDCLIYNYDDLTLRDYFKDVDAIKLAYSLKEKVDIYLEGKNFYYKGKLLINIEHLKLLGEHNLSNIAAALTMVVSYYGYDRINLDVLEKRIRNFGAVPHRLEYVARLNQISFYNDSKSTNIYATLAALKSFKNTKILLIVGGESTSGEISLLDEVKDNIKLVLVNGTNRKEFKDYFDSKNIKTYIYHNLDELLDNISEYFNDVDTVLFSPASVSFDQFSNFEERGIYFKNRIMELIKNKE